MDSARVFIKINENRGIVDIMGLIKDKIEDSRSILSQLDDLKNKEESELDLWNKSLGIINSGVDNIDRALMQDNQ